MKDNEKNSVAVALEYDGENPPIVSATGKDWLASEIIQIAKEHKIPILENSELARILGHLDTGESIPKELYIVIAQIIAFVYHLQGKMIKNKK